MSHFVFQTSQIPTAAANKSFSLHPLPQLSPRPVWPPAGVKFLRNTVAVKCSSETPPPAPSTVTDGGDSKVILERCFLAPAAVSPAPEAGPAMKGGKKPAMTLEKGKTRKKTKHGPQVETGGGGGDIGKIINFGGGDGGDDDGDDDDYFEFDDDDEGDEGGLFRGRKFLQELFDRKFIDAVLNEWQKTVMDLPAGLRQAYEMGLVSSTQMVRFLAINARPTFARAISRSLPQAISRAFIGRMLADPAFLYKLLLEQAATIGFSLWLELENRKDRIKEEWDLALLNVLTVTACNTFVVWSLAPCRSYGNTFRFDLQNTLQKLPNNIFERSYPLREFDIQKRIHSLLCKAAEFCLAGMTAGAIQGSFSNALASTKKDRVSMTIPQVRTKALGYGAFLGLCANIRYQMLCGLEKAVVSHFDVIGLALFLSTGLRLGNALVGEISRIAWLGAVEAKSTGESQSALEAYNRLSGNTLKEALVFGLGRLGIKQGNADLPVQAPTTMAHRKRIERKKVVA